MEDKNRILVTRLAGIAFLAVFGTLYVCSANAQPEHTCALPKVVNHQESKTEQEVHIICQEYVGKEGKPCAVIRLDERFCYAYTELDGSSYPIQCYEQKNVSEE